MLNTRESPTRYEIKDYYRDEAIEKIRSKLKIISYKESFNIAFCIAHTHFDYEKGGSELAMAYDLNDVELSSVLEDEDFFWKKYQDSMYDRF